MRRCSAVLAAQRYSLHSRCVFLYASMQRHSRRAPPCLPAAPFDTARRLQGWNHGPAGRSPLTAHVHSTLPSLIALPAPPHPAPRRHPPAAVQVGIDVYLMSYAIMLAASAVYTTPFGDNIK